MSQAEQRTQSLYRGVLIYWYRYADEGQPLTYATTWQLGFAWHTGPTKHDIDAAVRAAERKIDAQLRTMRGSVR